MGGEPNSFRQLHLLAIYWIYLRCFAKVKHILPNGGEKIGDESDGTIQKKSHETHKPHLSLCFFVNKTIAFDPQDSEKHSGNAA